MQSATLAATPSGSSAYPDWKSAFTGSGVAATISRMCARIMSPGKSLNPSGSPRENAKPAEVVASALKPRCWRYRAGSHVPRIGQEEHRDRMEPVEFGDGG